MITAKLTETKQVTATLVRLWNYVVPVADVLLVNDVELQAALEEIEATFADWNDSIIYELGYANFDEANTTLYSTGISRNAIAAAWAALNP